MKRSPKPKRKPARKRPAKRTLAPSITVACRHCGFETDPQLELCVHCAKPLASAASMGATLPNNSGAGRGGIIMAFGLLAVFLLGPILGIPAWVMGQKDLKKIRRGDIDINEKGMTQAGMIIGIVGTFLSPVFLFISFIVIAVTINISSAKAVEANKQAMMKDAIHIARMAYEFRQKEVSAGGGGGSYSGFVLTERFTSNENGMYQVQIISDERINVVGASAHRVNNGLIAYVDSVGFVERWEFSGDFNPRWFRRMPRGEETDARPRT